MTMSTKPNLSVSVVIPCWNSAAQLKQNLPAVISAASRVNADIIVVDDASTDNSLQVLNQSWDYPISVYSNPTNLGYGATINHAVGHAKSDLVAVLNTDVRPALDCLANSLKYFSDNQVFALALNSGEGGMRVNWQRGLFHHFRDDTPKYSLWASGGQGIFDRRKWLALGGMDSLYAPFYWEDTDLGYNAWKRGWKIIWAFDAKCTHDHHQSVIANNFDAKQINLVAQRNQFLFIWKNIGDWNLILTHLLYLPYYFWQYPKTIIQALKLMPHALRRRATNRPYWQRRDHDILELWKQ